MEILTAVEVGKKLNIPISLLYYLMNTGKISLPDKKSAVLLFGRLKLTNNYGKKRRFYEEFL
ncbi:hypothetical protein [Candidatus Endomicrobiellum agilis]|uniref:hypothetical protein n=1 Tax=Candidatus Endomicrobiellum agilis TaxID=3238957 RepID=UPI00358C411E|nr:hypothetical protein [Endomicrobium sp.]